MADIAGILETKLLSAIYNRLRTDTAAYKVTSVTTKGLLYFTVLYPNSYETIPIQFVPEVIEINRQVDFAEIKPILRNIPKYQYSGGSTSLPLRLDFFSQEDDRSDVVNVCNKLMSLGYSDGFENEKPKVVLTWGNMFRGETWEVGSVKVQYSDFKSKNDFFPQQAYVDILLLLHYDKNPRWAEITKPVRGTVYYTGGDPIDSRFVSNVVEL